MKVLDECAFNECFMLVEMPKKWKLKATGNTYWTEIYDGNNEKIANIFYKAAFYDRRADIQFLNI